MVDFCLRAQLFSAAKTLRTRKQEYECFIRQSFWELVSLSGLSGLVVTLILFDSEFNNILFYNKPEHEATIFQTKSTQAVYNK